MFLKQSIGGFYTSDTKCPVYDKAAQEKTIHIMKRTGLRDNG
jgi:hypothetical protein